MKSLFKHFSLILFFALILFLASCTQEASEVEPVEDYPGGSSVYREPIFVEPFDDFDGHLIPDFSGANRSGGTDEPEEVCPVYAFDAFLEREFLDFVTSCPLILRAYLRNPASFGVTDFEVTWDGFIPLGHTAEELNDLLKRIEEFHTFDREELTNCQQQSYELLAQEFDLLLQFHELEVYYYLSPFQGSSGIHQLLPLMLSGYPFSSIEDVEDYLSLLSEIGVVFGDAFALEEKRIERGLTLPDRIINEIIADMEGFLVNPEENMLLTSFESRIRFLGQLSEEEMAEYIERNETLFFETFIPVYENLILSLEGLRGNTYRELGLAHFDKGQDFYRLQLERMGSSFEPADLFAHLDQLLREKADEHQLLLFAYPEVQDYIGQPIHHFNSPEEIMSFLFEQGQEPFPPLPEGTSYRIRRIDAGVDGFASGYFVQPQLDSFLVNFIYYNPNIADNNLFMYTLMAHEGIGHLLQFVHLFSSELPDFRKVNTLDNTANIEGWAMYAQFYCLRFLELSELNYRRILLWEDINFLLMGLMDLGIHYKGWTLEESIQYFRGIPSLDLFSDTHFIRQFERSISNPLQVIPYVSGLFEMRLLEQHFKFLLAENFDYRAFHEAFLDKGPAPFHLIRGWMEESLME